MLNCVSCNPNSLRHDHSIRFDEVWPNAEWARLVPGTLELKHRHWTLVVRMAIPYSIPICNKERIHWSIVFGNWKAVWCTYPASSATCDNNESTSPCGMAVVVVWDIVFSMYELWTSKSSNCCSNLSISDEIFSKFIPFMAASIARTTPAIEFVTWKCQMIHWSSASSRTKLWMIE